MSLALGLMIGGGLVAVMGLLLLFNHSGTAKIIFGIVLAAAGLGCTGIGYTIDQHTEVTYTVQEITAVSARDSNNNYRVTLKAENGTETWIYVTETQLYSFPKGEKVTMKKNRIKALREQKIE